MSGLSEFAAADSAFYTLSRGRAAVTVRRGSKEEEVIIYCLIVWGLVVSEVLLVAFWDWNCIFFLLNFILLLE